MNDNAAAAGGRPAKVGVVVIHGVGEAEPGWINDYIVDRLAEPPFELEARPGSEVYRLEDKGIAQKEPSRNKASKLFFNAYLRRANDRSGAEVTFAELNWADLSRIGTGPFTHHLAALKLFFEAPDVMARGFLDRCNSPITRVIKFCILTASSIFRWLIAGSVLVFFLSGLILFAAANLYRGGDRAAVASACQGKGPACLGVSFVNENLAFILAAILLALAIGSAILAWRRVDRDIGLTDVGIGTMLVSSLFLLVLIANPVLGLDSILNLPSKLDVGTYYNLVISFNLVAWAVWCGFVALAFALLLVVILSRPFVRRRANAVPLRRLAIALWSMDVQAVGWNIVIPPAALALRWLLDQTGFEFGAAGVLAGGDSYKDLLQGATVFSLISLSVSLAGLLIILFYGKLVHALAGKNLDRVSRRRPRLIVSRLLITAGLATMAIHIFVFLAVLVSKGKYGERLPPWIPDLIAFLEEHPAWVAFSVMVLLLVLYLFRTSLDGILHIARDLVDHQYRRSYGPLSRMLPQRSQMLTAHPRRGRILLRVDELMKKLVAKERFDNLIFLTHSQGTIIMSDYLRSFKSNEVLDQVGEIHIVTLGSPLTYLYQHYFGEYSDPLPTFQSLHPNLKSWTNYWRIDDPIGSRIDIIADGSVTNRPLPLGGHTDYWREADIRRLVVDLIRGSAPVPAGG